MNGAIEVLPWWTPLGQRHSEHGNRIAGAVGAARGTPVCQAAPTLT
jgi:hypothetical protein